MLCCRKPAKVAESPEVRSGAGYWHTETRKCGHTGRVLRSSQNLMRSSWYQALLLAASGDTDKAKPVPPPEGCWEL